VRRFSLSLLLEVRDAGADGLLDLRLPFTRRGSGGGFLHAAAVVDLLLLSPSLHCYRFCLGADE
jgi:hypothetical protein